MGLDGWVPGEADLALGVGWVRDLAEKHDLPGLAANLTCGGAPLFPPSRLVTRGDVTLGVVGVLGDDLDIEGCAVSDPIAAVRGALPTLAGADLIVVLSHEGREADKALAEAVPEVDLVINGHARASFSTPEALPGDALALAAGSRGKSVGVATITLVPGASGFQAEGRVDDLAGRLDRYRERFTAAKAQINAATTDEARERAEKRVKFYEDEVVRLEGELEVATAAPTGPRHTLVNELIGLGTEVADHAATLALVTEAKVAVAAVELQVEAVTDAVMGPFIGGAACVSCHPGPAAQWRGTAHARAWGSLVTAGRTMDRDCYGCHATGAFHPEGPQRPSQVGELATVQCEACHGPGREHAAVPTAGQMVRSPDTSVCTTCHDGVRDEGRFDLEKYLPAVTHADAPG